MLKGHDAHVLRLRAPLSFDPRIGEKVSEWERAMLIAEQLQVGGQELWTLAPYKFKGHVSGQGDTITSNALLRALARGSQWLIALELLGHLRKRRVANLVSCLPCTFKLEQDFWAF